MTRSSLVVLVSAVVLLAAPLSAQIVAPQPVSFTGVIEEVPDPVPGLLCAPPEFQMACNGGVIFLESTTLELADFVGQNVRMTAVSSTPLCPLYDVTAIDPPEATLTICGTAGFGCPLRIRSGPGGLSQHGLFFSLAPGFVPISVAKGSFLLGEPNALLFVAFSGDPEGVAVDFVLPTDVNLIGVTFYFQAVRRDVGPIGPLRLSNAACFTPVGFTLLCIEPDC